MTLATTLSNTTTLLSNRIGPSTPLKPPTSMQWPLPKTPSYSTGSMRAVAFALPPDQPSSPGAHPTESAFRVPKGVGRNQHGLVSTGYRCLQQLLLLLRLRRKLVTIPSMRANGSGCCFGCFVLLHYVVFSVVWFRLV